MEALQACLKEKPPFSERILSNCPLLPIAAGWMLGLILQRQTQQPLSVWLVVLTFLIAAFFLIERIQQASRRLAWLFVLCMLTSLTAGAVRLHLYQTPSSEDIRRKMRANPSLATLGGIIQTEPQIENRKQWLFGSYQWTPPATSFVLAVEEALTDDGWQQASGRLAVSINQPVRTLSAGQRIRFHCTLQFPPRPDNPGMFDYADALAAQGIFLTAEIPGIEAIEAAPPSRKTRLLAWIHRFRSRVAESLHAFSSGPEDSSSLPAALLLGNRSGLNPAIQAAFRKTGLAHFLSLSGMHVGILAGILWGIGRLLGIGKRTRSVLCMVLLLVYALLVPPRAPTLRAVVLAQFLLLSTLLKQRSNPLNTLSFTAVVLLLFRPMDLFTAGWQLSYASVAGILFFYEPICSNLVRRLLNLPFYSAFSESALGSLVCPFLESVLKLLSVGLAAWLGGAGILLYHFGSFTPLAALWTVLLFPIVFLILLLGFIKILLLPLLPTAAAICSIFLDQAGDLFCTLTATIADANLFSFRRAGVYSAVLCLAGGCSFSPGSLPNQNPCGPGRARPSCPDSPSCPHQPELFHGPEPHLPFNRTRSLDCRAIPRRQDLSV
jgi:ComEC/Rec2-related protein